MGESTEDPVVTMFGMEGLGRAFLLSSLIGFVLTFACTGGIALVAGTGVVPAIGIGCFAGLWGGPGFGGMLGMVGLYERLEH